MLKKNRNILLLTTLVTALPMLPGLLLWDRLPRQVATHFDFNGVANGWSDKAFAVVGLPLFMVAVHLFCAIATLADPRRRNIQTKVLHMVLWICPVVSLLVNSSIYLYALGMEVDMTRVSVLMTGVLFLVVGNYMPKCRQNYTVGIKLPWTLADEENWDRTHRLAGRLWMAAGALLLLSAFLPGVQTPTLLFGVILAVVLIPTVYSFCYYWKHQKNN